MLPIETINPLDGRYLSKVKELSNYFSESALFHYRIIVEGEYLIALSENKETSLRSFTNKEKTQIRSLYSQDLKTAERIKEIEATINHDVKAVEYFLKEELGETSLKAEIEWLHFALTSEDTNNLAYALMLAESVKDVLLPTLKKLANEIKALSLGSKNSVMLARTHGQPASPTTMGKELKIYYVRLKRQIDQLKNFRVLAKINGATGNYNAHFSAFPKVDWPKFSKKFIASLSTRRGVNLEPNLMTAQIEPHDTYAELFDIIRRINIIIIDFDQDIWRYISDGWIKQRVIKNEVGSSTMPHKVNPIDFENSEGNLGMANALLNYFSNKLPISRLQRDLSDSTVERNFGVAFGYTLLAYKSTMKGLAKLEVNEEKLLADLERHPEVLAEMIQIIFRKEGLPMPYEQLKELTRGKEITKKKIDIFIDELDIRKDLKKVLKGIGPKDYIGLADQLVDL